MLGRRPQEAVASVGMLVTPPVLNEAVVVLLASRHVIAAIVLRGPLVLYRMTLPVCVMARYHVLEGRKTGRRAPLRCRLRRCMVHGRVRRRTIDALLRSEARGIATSMLVGRR